MKGSLDRRVVLAFLGVVVIGGLNGVAVRFSNAELDFLWGAALRFGLASVLLFSIVALRRLPLPRGRTLLGSSLYGLFGFALAYGFAYYGFIETPASVGMVILAIVPLLTLLLAVAHGLERLSLQSLAGSLLALVGVAIIFWERLETAAVPLISLLAVVGAAFCIAETGVIVKRFPRPNPVVNNALAMAFGGLLLLAAAVISGQRLVLPGQPETVAAVGYLVTLGSVVLFMLFLFVVERWTASATSYSLLLMPLPAAIGGALLLGEPITLGLVLGGLIVLAGVYLGAFAPRLAMAVRWPRRRAETVPPVTEASAYRPGGPADLISPGCP